jgi:SagB-type dehydrogenase family enzyme
MPEDTTAQENRAPADPATAVVRSYAEAVFRRGREPMEPVGFSPDWADQPSRYKTYLGVQRFPLPAGTDLACASASQVLLGGDGAPGEDGGWTLASLAALLRISYGLLDRRLRINWNQDADVRVLYPEALWGRAAASGGGMYPLEIYWVTAGAGPMTPGVYHYSTAHHAFERLAAGTFTDQVRQACPSAGSSDGYLLVTVRFWKNSFKYNSFCYHVVTQDCGALLGCWEMVARGMGRSLRSSLWFDERPLDALLGLDTEEESVLAVVPVPAGADRGGDRLPQAAGVPQPALTARPSFERSRRVRTFEQVQEVHRAVLADRRPLPATDRVRTLAPVPPAGDETVTALPAPRTDLTGMSITDVLCGRHTSFGSFTGARRLRLDELATILAGTLSAQDYTSDTVPADLGLTGLYVFANRVEDLASGAYHYDRARHALRTIAERPLSMYLQRSYFLSNYNLEQVGAVLAISARLDSTLQTCGSRGYRMLNAEVGAVAQTAYAAAAAVGVGCGAVLGFDNIALDEALGLDDGDERTFLFVLLGHERADRADFAFRLH